jgi:DNA repair protein RecO (recombination protein O)
MCPQDKRLACSELSVDSRAMAEVMFRAPIENFAGAPWARQRCADLRRFLVQILERHMEKKLVTATMLDKLD